jgi:hypothetical protein
MAKTTNRTREGWPWWAVSRMECTNCGSVALSRVSPPHYVEPSFDDWVRSSWPVGRSQMTRLGFRIWCSPKCEHAWKRVNRSTLEKRDADGYAHQLRIRQEEKAWQAGLVG